MEESQQTTGYGQVFASWQVPEYDKHERSKNWYIAVSAVVVVLLAYSYFTANFLFAVIIIVGSMVVIINDGQEPALVDVGLATDGVIVGKKFYDYDEIKHFAIVYKPNLGVKKIYFEFKNVVKPRLSIALANLNPLPIRENLLKYLPEDLERTDEPLSEKLANLFKL